MDDVNKYEIACRCPAADASLFRVFNKQNLKRSFGYKAKYTNFEFDENGNTY